MAKGSTFLNDLLKLVFNATAIANLADNAASSPVATLYVSLHTADPSAGNQTTNETGYTSYARVGVTRNGSNWLVSGASVTPANDVNFPTPTGGSGTLTHWAVGTASSGTGKVLYAGTVSPSITVTTGVPIVLAQSTAVTES